MEELLNSLSLEEKIGQRFIFGTNTENIDIIEKLIKERFIGGVILYKRNYKSYEEMLSVIKRLKLANKDNKVPLFIAIDQEGGKVNRMPKEIHNLKNIYDVSKKNPLFVNDYAKIIGKMLNGLGINMNLAPVLDIYNNSDSGAVYKRCFYGNDFDISKLGERYLKELEGENVIGVLKHFPGHGITRFDSHHLVPYIYDYNSVLDKHIKPFNTLLNKADVVMTGHIVIRKLTGFYPASISDKFLNRFLRGNDSFNGLIITDEINMLKRHPLYRFVFMKRAIQSTNDLLLIKIKSIKEGYKIIKKHKRVNNDLLDESVLRILNIKDKYHISDDVDNLGLNIDEINNMIDDINKYFDLV